VEILRYDLEISGRWLGQLRQVIRSCRQEPQLGRSATLLRRRHSLLLRGADALRAAKADDK